MEEVKKIARKAAGLRYDSPQAQRILNAVDWADFWPICDGDGILTGEITDSAQEGYLNIDDLCMVAEEDVPVHRRSDGYATIARKKDRGYVRAKLDWALEIAQAYEDEQLYIVLDERLGSDPGPFPFDLIMERILEINLEEADSEFDVVIRNDRSIYDLNTKRVVAELFRS